MLKTVKVVEVLWGLHHGQSPVREVRHHACQEFGMREVVGIDDEDEVGIAFLQGLVDVAGLRVLAVDTGAVPDADRLGEVTNPRSITVVEYPYLSGSRNSLGCHDRGEQHLERLAVGGHEYVDMPRGQFGR